MASACAHVPGANAQQVSLAPGAVADWTWIVRKERCAWQDGRTDERTAGAPRSSIGPIRLDLFLSSVSLSLSLSSFSHRHKPFGSDKPRGATRRRRAHVISGRTRVYGAAGSAECSFSEKIPRQIRNESFWDRVVRTRVNDSVCKEELSGKRLNRFKLFRYVGLFGNFISDPFGSISQFVENVHCDLPSKLSVLVADF